MRILVTGSRVWDDPSTIHRAFKEIHSATYGREANLLVHGGAVGADSMAAHYAAIFGWGIEEHLADWKTHGRKAGFVRNSEMVNLGADICLAFIQDESRGATMTADLAEKAGIRTKRYVRTSSESV